MEITRAIQQRHSVRAFKPDAVPQKVLKEIMALAVRAPSWANVQPWKLAIVTGAKLEAIKQGFLAKADEPTRMEIPAPPGFPEPHDTRRRAFGSLVFEINNIGRDDDARRKWWRLQGLQLFGAPCVIYILTDRNFYQQGDKLNVWTLFDCGLIAENIMLLATSHGLGTIPQAQAVHYPDVVRKVLGLPESELIVLGIPIGYPLPDAPINSLRSQRDAGDSIIRFYGFEK